MYENRGEKRRLNIQFQRVIEGLKHHAGIHDWGCWKDNGDDLPEEFCSYYDDKDNGEPACGTKLLTDTIELLKEYDSALRTMVYQYCTIDKQFLEGKNRVIPNPDQEVFFNSYMCAGEEAFKVLGIKNGEEVPEDWLRW